MSAADEIARYFDLFKAGAITEAEFTAAKAKLLGTTTPPPANTPTDTRGAAALKTPPSQQKSGNNQNNNSKNNQRSQGGANPLQTAAAVATGVVGGHLIADRLLGDPSSDPATFATETITFENGDVMTGAAVEMPNGDVFYSITEDTGGEVINYSGTMTAEEVEEFNNDTFDTGSDFSGGAIVEHHHHHIETPVQDSGSDGGGFDGFDFF